MSWLLNLYETYNNHLNDVGKVQKNSFDREYTLLPISHTTQNAHIEVNITEDGEFHSAEVIDKENATTLIPCTEASASRAGSKIAPYPLHDKLSYVAGDYVEYGGEIKKEEPFKYYIGKLKDWANSPYSNNKIVCVYNYLNKKQLIKDLVEEKVLYLDEDNQLIGKWDRKYQDFIGEKPSVFTVATGGQGAAFIRFNIYSPTKQLTDIWRDTEVYQSFIQFYDSKSDVSDKDICFIKGEFDINTERHANKIRHAADKAKIISANDTSGFTFRGRFKTGLEVASISYEVSQKAHNALKWLIRKQGKIIDNRVFLVWGNKEIELPDPNDDSYFFAPPSIREKGVINTVPEYANEIAKALDGYKSDLEHHSEVNILILDSATTGRIGIQYYRNLNKELYLDRLKNWHSTCVWLHRYRKNKEGKAVYFYGAPATRDIAFAAYGPRASDKLVKGVMERMLPCILDGAKIPNDIVRSAYHRASNPVSMEKWEWEKTLSITCALINRLEGETVGLNIETNNRDYLFGRLLALADVLERSALSKDEKRATNAIRYMNAFSQNPERTWMTIQSSIQPYQAKLGRNATYYSKQIDEIASRIQIEDFNNKPLTGKYLLGFYSQRHELYQKKEKQETTDKLEER